MPCFRCMKVLIVMPGITFMVLNNISKARSHNNSLQTGVEVDTFSFLLLVDTILLAFVSSPTLDFLRLLAKFDIDRGPNSGVD